MKPATAQPSKCLPKSQRYNEAQKDLLLKFMEEHSLFALGRFTGLEGKLTARRMWDELSSDLNSVGPPKECSQWQTVWRDLKFKTSKKVTSLRQALLATGGNKPGVPQLLPLSAFEIRVAGIVGTQYLEGASTVAESLPEANDSLECLMAGKEPELQALMPTIQLRVPSVASYESRSQSHTGNDEPCINPSPGHAASDSTAIPRAVQQYQRRERIGVTLMDARMAHQQIAESQADAMQMLAGAALRQAQAMEEQNENNRQQTDVNRRTVELLARLVSLAELLAARTAPQS